MRGAIAEVHTSEIKGNSNAMESTSSSSAGRPLCRGRLESRVLTKPSTGRRFRACAPANSGPGDQCRRGQPGRGHRTCAGTHTGPSDEYWPRQPGWRNWTFARAHTRPSDNTRPSPIWAIEIGCRRFFDRMPIANPSVAAAAAYRASTTNCQSAPNRDPGSASKRDPTFLRFEQLALAPSELVGVAETGRSREAPPIPIFEPKATLAIGQRLGQKNPR